jgi:hypothetical protein
MLSLEMAEPAPVAIEKKSKKRKKEPTGVRKQKKSGESPANQEKKARNSESRTFNGYLKQVWKEFDDEKEKKFKRSAAVLKAIDDWIAMPFLSQVTSEWMNYSSRTNKTLVTDSEIAEQCSTMWGPTLPSQPFPMHKFCKERVQEYHASNSKMKQAAAAPLKPTSPTE